MLGIGRIDAVLDGLELALHDGQGVRSSCATSARNARRR